MGCATIDGTLAIDFGQKSRLGGVLNEAGDVVSDVCCSYLGSVVPFSASSVGRSLCSQFRAKSRVCRSRACGSRRVDGPMARLTVESR